MENTQKYMLGKNIFFCRFLKYFNQGFSCIGGAPLIFFSRYISVCAPTETLNAILEQLERNHHFSNWYKQPYQSVNEQD